MKKLKKTTKQYIIVAALCTVVIGGTGGVAYAAMYGQLKTEYKNMEQEMIDELEVNQREVYVAIAPIAKGEFITSENTEYKKVYATQPQETYLTAEDIGKTAIISLDEGIHILKTMVTDSIVDETVREVSYDVVLLNSNIVNNDTVDIRLQYPNGENYVVLSKKIVKLPTESLEESYYWMTEEEIVRMSSAIVDAYLYEGSVLYTAKYIEPNLQEPSYVTYTPSLSNIELIKENPNIIDTASQYLNEMVRKKVENRLSESLNLDTSSIDWKVDNSTTSVTTTPATSTVSTDDQGFAYFTEEEEDKENSNEFGE